MLETIADLMRGIIFIMIIPIRLAIFSFAWGLRLLLVTPLGPGGGVGWRGAGYRAIPHTCLPHAHFSLPYYHSCALGDLYDDSDSLPGFIRGWIESQERET